MNLIGIVGMGGVGKTQLAVEFGYRFSYAFTDGVFWIQGANTGEWLRQLVEIARDLLAMKVKKVKNDANPDELNLQYVTALRKYFSVM